MAFAWSITCTRCRFKQMAGLDAFSVFYWLGTARFAPIPFVGAWCNGCRKVALAEEVPDSAKLAERADGLLRFYRNRGLEPGEDFYDRKVQQFAAQLEWRAQRVGPPRCLLCRSAAVSPLDMSGQPPLEFPHPGCRGQLRCEVGWHYHTRGMWVYSVEGDFLGFATGFAEFEPPSAPLSSAESGLGWWVSMGCGEPEA